MCAMSSIALLWTSEIVSTIAPTGGGGELEKKPLGYVYHITIEELFDTSGKHIWVWSIIKTFETKAWKATIV